jgi:replicative DNA helicase
MEAKLFKMPPQNIEAEQATLGGILLENDSVFNVLEILQPEDFYKDSHRIIFTSIIRLVEKNEPVDIVTLTEQLQKDKDLERVGGASFIAFLSDCVPTAANIEHYANIVKEKAILRNIINVSTQIINDAYLSDVDLSDFIDKTEKSIFAVTARGVGRTYLPIRDIIKSNFEKLETLYQKKNMVTGIPTGFNDLDKILSGFQPSDFVIIAGRPSMGKTSLCLNMITHCAIKENVPVAFFSLEMSHEQLGLKMLSSEARVDFSRVRTGFLEETDWVKLAKAAGKLSEAPIFIDDTPAISINEIRARARRLKRECNVGAIVIDYLQLVHVSKKVDSREREISIISASLKALAKELHVPVIALAQLNRLVESRTDKRPMLADLRESGSIEQDADVVSFIYRDEYYNESSQDKGIAEIIVAKQRNGPTGTVKLAFINQYTRFENLAT